MKQKKCKLLGRGKRQHSGIFTHRGPGTSKSYSQIRMHSSKQKNARIEPVVLKLAKKIDNYVLFAGRKFKNFREANNWYLLPEHLKGSKNEHKARTSPPVNASMPA